MATNEASRPLDTTPASAAQAHLQGLALVLVRAVWLATFVAVVLIFAASVPAYVTYLHAIRPTGVDIDHTAGNAVVGILWNSSAGATSYRVRRSRHRHSGYHLLGSATAPPFADHHTLHGRSYYTVSARNRYGESRPSRPVRLDRM